MSALNRIQTRCRKVRASLLWTACATRQNVTVQTLPNGNNTRLGRQTARNRTRHRPHRLPQTLRLYPLPKTPICPASPEKQTILAQLVIGHRGDRRKMADIVGSSEMLWYAVLSPAPRRTFLAALRLPFGSAAANSNCARRTKPAKAYPSASAKTGSSNTPNRRRARITKARNGKRRYLSTCSPIRVENERSSEN